MFDIYALIGDRFFWVMRKPKAEAPNILERYGRMGYVAASMPVHGGLVTFNVRTAANQPVFQSITR